MANNTSIDNIKSLINRRGGIARGNRYKVHIIHPIKNNLNNPMKTYTDPSPITKWGPFGYLQKPDQLKPNRKSKKEEHKFAEFITDGRDTHMLCTNVTLPGKRITTTEATHNHNLAKKPYSMATDEVSMTFLLTNDYYMKKYFDVWMEMVIDSSGNHYKTLYKEDYTADVEIQALYGNDTEQIGYGIKLENAYPIQISQVELGNEQEGLMQITITWEYDNWRAMHMEEGMEVSSPYEYESAIPQGEPRAQELPELKSAIPEDQPETQELPGDNWPNPGLEPAIPHGQPQPQEHNPTIGPAGQSSSIENQPAIPHGYPEPQRMPATAKPAIPHGQPSGQSLPEMRGLAYGPPAQDIPQVSARGSRTLKWVWRF